LAVGAAAGEFAAPLLSHAAGAWADAVARMAEVIPLWHRTALPHLDLFRCAVG
jgi:hypothetical protein